MTEPLFLVASPSLFEKIKTRKGERWQTRPSMERWMRKQVLYPNQAKLRVVCLGGSVTYGFPMPKEGAYPHILEAALNHLYPESKAEVVSMGMLDGRVDKLEQVLEEAMALQPHVVVLEVGSMETLSRWGVGEGKYPPAFLREGSVTAPPMDRSLLKGQPLAEIENKAVDGLRRILDRLQKRKVEVIVLCPGTNLKARPLYDDSDEVIDSRLKKQVSQLMGLVENSEKDDAGYTIRCLDRVLQLVPESPSFQYISGQYLEKYGHYDKALEKYQRGVDLDRQPLRPSESLRVALKRLAEELDVPFVAGQKLANGFSKNGISGYDEFFDHLHPRRELHLVYARMILRHMGVKSSASEINFSKALGSDWKWNDREWSDVWNRSGQALTYCGESSMARRLFQKSLEFNLANFESQISLADLLMREGEAQVASGILRQVLSNENWVFISRQLKIRLAEVLAMQGMEESLTKIIQSEGVKDSDPAWGRVFAFLNVSKKKDAEAIPYFKVALEENPLDPLLLKGLEVAYLRSNRWVDYIEWLKVRLVDKRSRSKVMTVLKTIEVESETDRELARAGIDLIRLFLSLDDKNELAPWIVLAKLYGRLELTHRTIESLERCLLLSSAYDLPLNVKKLEGWVEELKEGANPFEMKKGGELFSGNTSSGNVSPQVLEVPESKGTGAKEPASSRQ